MQITDSIFIANEIVKCLLSSKLDIEKACNRSGLKLPSLALNGTTLSLFFFFLVNSKPVKKIKGIQRDKKNYSKCAPCPILIQLTII